MLLLRVLELRVRQSAQALDEEHDRRDAAASDLGGVVERSARQTVRRARDLVDRLVREVDERAVGSNGRGPITKEIQSAFFSAVHGETPRYASWLTYVR